MASSGTNAVAQEAVGPVAQEVVALSSWLGASDAGARSGAVDALASLTGEVFGADAIQLGQAVRRYGVLPQLVWLLAESPEDDEQVCSLLSARGLCFIAALSALFAGADRR